MARLQDFQTVTPTSSDNILIVQSQGQGLAPYTIKLDSANPTGTGALSLNRKANTTTGDYSSTTGYNCEASGPYSFANGYQTKASGNYSLAEGNGTTASGSGAHAEGYNTSATANYGSHAEGRETTATAIGSHAEGYQTTTVGQFSHAEGVQTTTNGDNGAHAEGQGTECNGRSSHAEGLGTISTHLAQHVFGSYNVADTSTAAATAKGTYIEIVGKGTAASNRSNARTLDWNGNETIAGTLTQSSDARLKEVNTEEIPDVSGVKAIRFNWKKNIGRDFSEHIGYLAQDVEQVLPFLVKTDAEGHKTLDYIAFLVAKIDSLEKRISELEKGEKV